MKLLKFQKRLETIKDTIPLLSKLVVTNLKDNLEKNGANLLENVNGVVGITIKLFGQELIENYFDNLKEKRLENYGLGLYIKAASTQAINSLNSIEDTSLQEHSKLHIIDNLEQLIQNRHDNIDNSDLVLHYNPKKHPATVLIRNMCEDLLEMLIISDPFTKNTKINAFIKHFNENIENEVKEQFGDEYDKHLNTIKDILLTDNEWKLLNAMTELEKIGFETSENLSYQQAFASWKPVDEYRGADTITAHTNMVTEIESQLQPVEEMINSYFNTDEDHLDKILFIIADFGKGKSVFLRKLASKLAKKYQQIQDGDIPVYFNLREFDKYNQNSAYGIISDYLGKEFGINVTDEKFKKNNYFFLIDSLDESGNLTEERVNQVIQSIKKIQNIDYSLCRRNKIIIATRPIESNLYYHLNANKPFSISNTEGRSINQFLSLHGFKKEQFNNWIYDCLSKSKLLDIGSLQGINKKIFEAVKNNKHIDIYTELFEKEILSYSELRRPLFAYMIYKLIISNTELSATNKVGVYLSFINVLTKEAKYINDTNSLNQLNLLDEFRFRNILHSTAALWMHENYKNGQGFLRKDDISNVLEGAIIDKNDKKTMEKYKEVTAVEFLSQSYFGQNGGTFYFQHQSFAEMLLAEYYLKIFISFALNEHNPEEARIMLNLGNPTEQTIDFLMGLINLLKDSVSTDCTYQTIEKRKLLFPLLASMSINDFSKQLHTHYLKYTWFDKVKIKNNTTIIPEDLLINWPITEDVIDKIVSLSVNILESKSKYLITDIQSKHSSLFNEEVVKITKDLDQIPPDIDKWIALLVGNSLYTNMGKKVFFNRLIKDSNLFINLMKNWGGFTGHASPDWGKSLFVGMHFAVNQENHSFNPSYYPSPILNPYTSKLSLNGLVMDKMNFSHSILNGITFLGCLLFESDFSNCTLHKVVFESTNLNSVNFSGSLFENSEIIRCVLSQTKFYEIGFNTSEMGLNEITQGAIMPEKLENIIKGTNIGLSNPIDKVYFSSDSHYTDILEEFSSLFSLLTAINKRNKIKIDEIKGLFNFNNPKQQNAFDKKLEEILL
ncbi:NACHT domain-containing protein [Bacillus thuringiensis]|uniref:NACHT domain-containing protein n=1 Tax=Bacillus thuringiensis TaxID=1428 RepID=UPI0013F17953|nr:pentapeptide repeat-containing protein [Bacillus thuringiensis]